MTFEFRQMIATAGLLLLAWATPATAQPHIFYSDLEGGPANGSENNAGAWVTIHGTRFGAARGTSAVTIGQTAAYTYRTWTASKISFQIAPGTKSGSITVHTDKGTSNEIPFTVRSGKIYFVAPNGSDSASGSFSSPWKSLLKARNSMQSGDITYARDGVTLTTDDGEGWNTTMLLRVGGSPDKPLAIVAYPEARVTLGTINGPSSAIRSMEQSPGYWVFAGLTLRGQNEAVALYGGSHWRFVDNDMSCPNGNYASACFESSVATYLSLLGNTVHDTGQLKASALYHGVYFSTDTNHVEVGWNQIYNVRGCRGIQVHSSPLQGGGPSDPTGHNQYDISIHDNLIHDTQCDGIVLATVDPSKGKVEIFNNVIYNAGKGPANPENSGNWSCIFVGGYTNTGPTGGGIVDIYNNTFVNCGTFATPPYREANNAIENGGANPNLSLRIRNNIIVQPQGIPYLGIPGSTGITGSNNLFYGNGSAPSHAAITNSINRDPQFLAVASNDYRLSPLSPARKAGIETPATWDRAGQRRSASDGYDLGAYQVVAAGVTTLHCPPFFITPGQLTCEVEIASGTVQDQAVVTVSSADTAVEPTSVNLAEGALVRSVALPVASVTERSLATISAASEISEAAANVWLLPSDDRDPLLLTAVNAASYQQLPVAGQSLLTLFGHNLTGPVNEPGRSGDTGPRVSFDSIPAQVVYADSNQVTVVVPDMESDSAVTQISLVNGNGQECNALDVAVASFSPGLFTADATGRGQALALNQDGGRNSSSHPAARGSVTSLLATGLPAPVLDSAAVSDSEDPEDAEPERITVAFEDVLADPATTSVEPFSVKGVYRIEVQIPATAPARPDVAVTVTAGGISSQPGVTVAIH
jgi:uncharacterized protein (TIGR03437 family)